MKFNSIKKRREIRCFSLPELLIAIAITIGIAAIFGKIFDATSKTMRFGQQMIDSTAEARFVFERINTDLKNMICRSDTDYHMTNAGTGTDFFRFISQIGGPNGDRNISLIGYKIAPDENGFPVLFRGVHGYNWENVGYMGLDENGLPPSLLQLPTELNLKSEEYELLSKSVFHVAVCFQYKSDGKIHQNLPFVGSGTNQFQKMVQITNVASVIVGLAVIDVKSKEMLSLDQSLLLVSKFEDVPDGITPLSHWSTNLEYQFPKFAEGLPKIAAQSVRVYQRCYPLN